MSNIDFLDFDITLDADAQRFGLKAQGDACVDDTVELEEPPVIPEPPVPIPEPEPEPEILELLEIAVTEILVTPSPAFEETAVPRELYEALLIAKEVYGETNSEHSEVFCHWIDDVLLGATTERETKEMLEALHSDKEGFGGRLSWQRAINPSVRVEHLRARRHASICAMNIVRAILNSLRGLSYEQWIERSLYRATKAEGDAKGEPL